MQASTLYQSHGQIECSHAPAICASPFSGEIHGITTNAMAGLFCSQVFSPDTIKRYDLLVLNLPMVVVRSSFKVRHVTCEFYSSWVTLW